MVGICLLLAVASRFSYGLRPFDADAAIFIHQGMLVEQGLRYWDELIDNKLPTVGMLTFLPWRFFGNWWWGYVLLQTGMALIAAMAIGRAAVRAAGPHAWWPAVLFMLVYGNLNQAVFGGFQLETFHVFFASLAAPACVQMIAARGRCAGWADAMVVGLCAGMAAMAKPTGLSVMGAAGVALVVSRLGRKGEPMSGRLGSVILLGAAMLLGVAIPAAAVWIYLQQTGISAHLPAIIAQIRDYSANSATDVRDLNKLVWVAAILGVAWLGRGWVFRRQRLADGDGAGGSDRSARMGAWAFAIAWLVLELVGVVMQKRMYGYHFLVLAPAAGLIYAMLPRQVSARQMAMTLAPAMLISLSGVVTVVVVSWNFPKRLPSSEWLIAHAASVDRVWRDQGSRLLIETGLLPGSRIPLTFIFINSDDSPQRFWRILHEDFEMRRPRWIVLPADLGAYHEDTTTMVAELERLPSRRENYLRAWGELEAYVRSHYEPVAQVGREMIWERRR